MTDSQPRETLETQFLNLPKIPTMVDAKVAFEAAKALYGTAVKGLQELKWEHVSEPVRNYIREHPGLSGLQLVLLLVLTCPGLVLTPVLGAVGFSSIGPVAGKAMHCR